MTEKRYFQKEYDELYYIFDSTKISEEEVDIESEYGYNVFSNAMQGNEVVDRLNEQEEQIKELEIENKWFIKTSEKYIDSITEQKQRIKELQETIDTIAKDYKTSHGMDIRNAEWFTAW